MINRPVFSVFARAIPLFAVALAASALLVVSSTVSASQTQQARELTSGVVVGVTADGQGRLERFTLSDADGTDNVFTVQPSTEFGLESQSGDRWVSTQEDEPVEAVSRLRDHQRRFAAVTVSSQNGVALSVVERESGKLETNLSFLFAVFAVTWAGFFAYIFFVSRKQRVLQREVAQLRATMKRGDNE